MSKRITTCEHSGAQVPRSKGEILRDAAPEMFQAIGRFRALFTNKEAGIEFRGSEQCMIEAKRIFQDIEMAYRKAEGRS